MQLFCRRVCGQCGGGEECVVTQSAVTTRVLALFNILGFTVKFVCMQIRTVCIVHTYVYTVRKI